jgi:opacity protein-like surface antigen
MIRGRPGFLLLVLPALALTLLLGAGPAGEDSPVPPEQRSWIGKGTRTAGFWLGPAFGTRAINSSQQHDLHLAGVSYGRVLGGLRAPRRWYRGYLEIVGEFYGGRQHEPSDASLAGFTVLVRRDFAAGPRWLPFVQAGAGLTWADIRDGDLSTDLELGLQVGGGACLRVGRGLALTLQYRWVHLSNAGLDSPNLGVDAHLLAAGLTWFF